MTDSHWDLDTYFHPSLEKFSLKQRYTRGRIKAKNKRPVNIKQLYWVRVNVHLDQFLTVTANGCLGIHRKRAGIGPLTSSCFPRMSRLGMLKTVYTALHLTTFMQPSSKCIWFLFDIFGAQEPISYNHKFRIIDMPSVKR